MRKLLLFVLALFLIAVPVVSAQGDPALGAIEYLKTQKSDDGAYGEDVVSTSLATIALGMVDEPDAEAVAWLMDYAAEAGEEISLLEASWIVLAAVASDEDPTTFADGELITAFGTELAASRGEDIDALCLGLVALHSTGTSLPSSALRGLGMVQKADGGFPASIGGESDPAHTAVCAHVLAAAGDEDALTNAVAYLESAQAEDGGWSLDGEESSPILTLMVLTGLKAADEDLMGNWSSAIGYLMQNVSEDGAYDEEDPVESAALAALVFRGLSFNDIGAVEEEADEEADTDDSEMAMEEGPALDEVNWSPVADGFEMEELNTADDFFVMVIDPFTSEELYGIEIINWVAEYQYTGYIVEEFLPADVLLWMGEQDPTTWENISPAVVELLPDEVLLQLPADVQALAE